MKRIVVVDDDEAILKALRRLLAPIPLAIGKTLRKVAADGFGSPQLALDRARHTDHDLVLCDYRMPVVNGASLLDG